MGNLSGETRSWSSVSTDVALSVLRRYRVLLMTCLAMEFDPRLAMSDLMMKWEGAVSSGIKTKVLEDIPAPTVVTRRSKSSSSSPHPSSNHQPRKDPHEDGQVSSWWPVKPVAVLEWHELDESCREPGIHCGYRTEENSWSDCCRSLFCKTNETLNFWTHFIPALYFLHRLFRMSQQWGFLHQSADGQPDYYALPFLVFLLSATSYLLMSALAHGFSARSPKARDVCFFMDYAAISFYSFGSGLLYRAYVLPVSWMGPQVTPSFLSGAAFLSLASTAITCYSRLFVRDVVIQRLLRLAAFTLPYIWDTVPLLCRIFFGTGDGHDYGSLAVRLHIIQHLAAIMASFCYASHLPERILPGRFDYAGHSHNLLHIFGALATSLQVEASLIDLSTRRSHLTSHGLALMDGWWAGILPLFVLSGHIFLVLMFGRLTYRSQQHTNQVKAQ